MDIPDLASQVPLTPSETTLLAGQKRVLEMVATAAPLVETLTELIRIIEAEEPGLRAGILIVTDDGAHFRRGCGPRLPEAYHQLLDGVPITPPYLGPCGQAAHQGVAVVVPDIARDGRWAAPWRAAVLSIGLASCRSTPIFASDGKALASFAMYYRQPDPHWANPQLIEIATWLAGIAIERDRSQAMLRDREERLAAELAAARRLQDVSTQLIPEGDAASLYGPILDVATDLMCADMASMQLLDPQRNELRLLAWKEFHPDSAAFWAWVRFDSDSSCAAALKAGQRIVVSDIDACDFIVGTPDHDAYRRSGVRAVQSTPLFSRSGRLLGMISTHWRAPHLPSDRDFRLFDVLARQVADLTERNQAMAALRDLNESLEQRVAARRASLRPRRRSAAKPTPPCIRRSAWKRSASLPAAWRMISTTC